MHRTSSCFNFTKDTIKLTKSSSTNFESSASEGKMLSRRADGLLWARKKSPKARETNSISSKTKDVVFVLFSDMEGHQLGQRIGKR